jgi:hypothetical protein
MTCAILTVLAGGVIQECGEIFGKNSLFLALLLVNQALTASLSRVPDWAGLGDIFLHLRRGCVELCRDVALPRNRAG